MEGNETDVHWMEIRRVCEHVWTSTQRDVVDHRSLHTFRSLFAHFINNLLVLMFFISLSDAHGRTPISAIE